MFVLLPSHGLIDRTRDLFFRAVEDIISYKELVCFCCDSWTRTNLVTPVGIATRQTLLLKGS